MIIFLAQNPGEHTCSVKNHGKIKLIRWGNKKIETHFDTTRPKNASQPNILHNAW